MEVEPYKRDGVMLENMTNASNSVTKAANETAVIAMSSVSWLYQYFTFMSYFLGKENFPIFSVNDPQVFL